MCCIAARQPMSSLWFVAADRPLRKRRLPATVKLRCLVGFRSQDSAELSVPSARREVRHKHDVKVGESFTITLELFADTRNAFLESYDSSCLEVRHGGVRSWPETDPSRFAFCTFRARTAGTTRVVFLEMRGTQVTSHEFEVCISL